MFGKDVYLSTAEARLLREAIEKLCGVIGDTVRLVPRRYRTPEGVRERGGGYILFQRDSKETRAYAEGAYRGDKPHGIFFVPRSFTRLDGESENGMRLRLQRTLFHEVGHVLGFEHEQMHPERDVVLDLAFGPKADRSQYLRTCFDADTARCESTFNILGIFTDRVVVTEATPYDFLSVMHYPLGPSPGADPGDSADDLSAYANARGLMRMEEQGMMPDRAHRDVGRMTTYSDGDLMTLMSIYASKPLTLSGGDPGACRAE